MTEYVQVKDFERFQHYKDRDPPWIKLYVRLIEDYAFAMLPDAQKFHVVGCWILASKMGNKIPKDAKFVGDKICAKEPVDLDALLASGFLQPWSAESAVGKREEWPSRYVSAQTRADLLSAAQNCCVLCPATTELEIDHIVPVSRGGTGDLSNLQVLCRKCNRKKRARLRDEPAEQPRSAPLRRETDLRIPEAETEVEAETENSTTTSADAAPDLVPHNQQSVMRLIVDRLYFGNRPPERDMATNGSILRNYAAKRGFEYMARVVTGLALRRDAGKLFGVGIHEAVSLKWLNSAKIDLNQLAVSEDAYYRGDGSVIATIGGDG